MQIPVQMKIKNDPNLYRYLREHSYWYKSLNRDPTALREMEQEMKNQYRLTTMDKMEDISHTISLLQSVVDIIK